MTNLIRLDDRKGDQSEWWSAGRFRMKPSWLVGTPFLGVLDIEQDVRTAEEFHWLMQQVRQLRWKNESRTGRRIEFRLLAFVRPR